MQPLDLRQMAGSALANLKKSTGPIPEAQALSEIETGPWCDALFWFFCVSDGGLPDASAAATAASDCGVVAATHLSPDLHPRLPTSLPYQD